MSIAVEENTSKSTSLRRRFGALWPTSGATNSIGSLDGLRAVAVLLVMMAHCCEETKAQTSEARVAHWFDLTRRIWYFGATGVHLFFVLSGFLLFLPYARAALATSGFPSTRRFYVRRALRILPAYWASLAILAIFVQHELFTRTQLPNLGLHFLLLHDWSKDMCFTINANYWTLAFESQFYVFLPLIGAIVVWAIRARRYSAAMLLGIAMLCCGSLDNFCKATLSRHFPNSTDHILLFDIFGYLSVFGPGIIASFVFVLATEHSSPAMLAKIKNWCAFAGVGGVGLLAGDVLLLAVGAHLKLFSDYFFYLIAGTGYAGILLGVLLGWPAWSAIMSMNWLRFIGGISYSIYLWHYPLYHQFLVPLVVHHTRGMGTMAGLFLVNVFILIPICYLSYILFEFPFMRARQKRHDA